jgi:DNA uptake protein ComE-like DNA-binding protein
MQYTPITDPNATPQYGQSGPQVITAQAKYNQDNADGIKNGTVTPLATDGMYGPKTQAALLGDRQMVNDSSKAMSGYNNASLALDQHLAGLATPTTPTDAKKTTTDSKDINAGNYSDAYTQGLQGISDRSNASTKSMIATLQAQHQNEVNAIDKNYDLYSRGMQLLGIENGSAQFTPELLKGQLLEIKNQRLSKISDLDQKLNTAVMTAENARADKEFSVMKEQMDYVRQLKQDKAQAVKDLASGDQDLMKKADFFGNEIYDAISGLSGAQKTAALTKLSTELGIPVAYLLGAAASTRQDRIKKTSSSSSTSTASKKTAITNITNRLNSRTPDSKGYSVRGKDNYVDPDEYLSMYKQWSDAGYTDKEWLSQFPAKTYINPASYGLLPENMKPKTTAARKG